MNKKLLKGISVAGLFHDIGKFAERAYAVTEADKDTVWQDYRYGHAYNTEQVLARLFGERLSQPLPNKKHDNECTILNLAARHHNPRNIYETMVSEADRIASGHERAKADQYSTFETSGRERKSQIPLISILGRVRLPERQRTFKDSINKRYRIGVPPIGDINLLEATKPVDPENYPASQVRDDYKTHWDSFAACLISSEGQALDLIDNFDTVFEICRMYQWCLPASARKDDMEDSSLFEHQKITAALAACLCAYHENLAERDTNQLTEEAVRNRTIGKYLLFCGDISGIQSFIYQISSKGAYRALKGRSFFIQLLTEVLAFKYINHFSLTKSNILYASGGKFYIILPNLPEVKDILNEIGNEVNKRLFDRFNGQIFVRTGWKELSGDDLTRQTGRTLSQIWDALGYELVIEDRQRYAILAKERYDMIFGLKGKGKHDSCDVCHGAMEKIKGEGDQKCKTCREMEDLGKALGEASCIVVADDAAAMDTRYTIEILGYYLWLAKGLQAITSIHKNATIWTLNSNEFIELAKKKRLANINAAPMIVGGTHRFTKEFDEVAALSEGIHRLGIVRMDVDNLGRIFSHGLKGYVHGSNSSDYRFHSLGRITTLSWQLVLFFSGWVPTLIQGRKDWQDKVTIVYSGGDDLFLLGAWDALPEIALSIRKKFTEFTCANPSFTLSGGMVMTGGKFPIYKSAEMAGEAEESAKKHQFIDPSRTSGKEEKNAFTFLDTAMHWEEFTILKRLRDELLPVLRERESRPLLSRMRDVAASWFESRNQLLRSKDSLSIDEIRDELMAETWRWRMVYAMSRFAKEKANLREPIHKLQDFIIQPVANSRRSGIELLGVLSRWLELQLRTQVYERGGE